MINTLTRAEELRNDIQNLHFTCKYYIGVLAELEQLGKTNTKQFRQTERNVNVLKKNIRTLKAELEKAEEEEYLNTLQQRFMDEVDYYNELRWT